VHGFDHDQASGGEQSKALSNWRSVKRVDVVNPRILKEFGR